ncbi:MAG TPA: glycosyltransferase [Chitinophagaceae bacterium]|nr:glycosyltransferase [Chitinophagaceae bacterium]
MNEILISICIPAYSRTAFLQRLLDSIAMQTFRDFEVIVTDDTPGAEVREVCSKYADAFPLSYYKNEPGLGTPENWNEGIRRASGKWIKLMHDDDWFAVPGALQQFADAVRQHPQASFFFCAYSNVYEETGKKEIVNITSLRWKMLLKNKVTLFSSNIIGPPSVTLHRNDRQHWYDRNIKWVVDIDFYIRYLEGTDPVYIDQPLVNVGINPGQVTRVSFRKPEVEIPENFYLLRKVGTKHLSNLLVYDAWWRLMRNLHIRKETEVQEHGYHEAIPAAVGRIIRVQQKIPRPLLNVGVFSKMFMFVSYLFNRAR